MPIKIKPVIVAEDGVNEFKDSKSKIKTVIVAEDGVNTVKKKEPTELLSEQDPESTTLDIPKVTEQKPSVSLSSKDENIFSGYPGKEEKKYKLINNEWNESVSVSIPSTGLIPETGATVKIKDTWKPIQNEGRSKALNNYFNKDAYISPQDKSLRKIEKNLAENLGTEKNIVPMSMAAASSPLESQLVNAKTPAEKKDVESKMQVRDINRHLNDQDNVKKQKFDVNVSNTVNSNLIAGDETDATEVLNNKFNRDGFLFEEGLGDQIIAKYSPDGGITITNSETINLDAFKDATDAAESLKLQNFMKNSRLSIDEIKNLSEVKGKDDDEVRANFQKVTANRIKLMAEHPEKYGHDLISEDEAGRFIDSKNLDLKVASKRLKDDYAKLSLQVEDYNNNPTAEKRTALKNKQNELLFREHDIQSEYGELNKIENNLNKSIGNYIAKSEKHGNILGSITGGLAKGVTAINKTMLTESINALPVIDYVLSGSKIQDNPTNRKLKELGKTDSEILDLQSKEMQRDIVPKLDKAIQDIASLGSTSMEYVQSKDRGDLSNALRSISESLGAVAAGGNLSFFAQSYNSMQDQMRGKGFDGLTQNEKMLISAPYALVMGGLEKLSSGAELKLGKIGSSTINKIIQKTFTKDIPKDATEEVIKNAINNNLKIAISEGLLKVAGGSLIEGATEGVQSVAETAIKQTVNELKDHEYFQNVPDLFTAEGLLQAGKDALRDAKLGALGGAIMTGGAATFEAARNGYSDRIDDNKFAESYAVLTDDNLINAQKTGVKIDLKDNKISKQEAQDIIQGIDEASSIAKSIPETLSITDKRKAFNLLVEQKNTQKLIEGKNPELVSKQTDRVKAINEELKVISNKPNIEEDATKESEQPVQEISTESNISERQGTESGQQEVGQAEGGERTTAQPEANISDSNIPSEEKVVMPGVTFGFQPEAAQQSTFEDVASADNAGELARLYIEEVNSQSSVNAKDRAIHSVISKVNKDSYLRFGDASNISMGMAKTYFNKAGQSVDQVAQDASSLLTDDASTDAITPQDIIEYINKYQGGFNPAAPSGNARLKAINEKNIELTGKGLNSNIARVRANSIGREVEVEAIDSQIVRAMETSGLLSVMDDNINDEGFWTTFPGGFTKEEYELIKKEYNETSREELTRIESEIQSRANWDTEDATISTDAIEEGATEAENGEIAPEIKSNWNYEGEGDAFASNKEWRDGKLSYIVRILGNSYNRARQLGELDTLSPLTYKGDKEYVSAIDGNGNIIGIITMQGDGGIEHIVVAPEFERKGVASELISQIKKNGAKVVFEKTKLISPDAAKLFNKLQLSSTKTATFEEVKDLDTADKTNLQKVQSFLDKAISDLDQFGKETLGMNLPVATARIILRAVKVLVDAGVSLENALKQVAAENNVTVNDVVDTLTALSEKKKESEASKAAKKISVTPKTKVTVNEKTALKEQIKLEARAARGGYKAGKEKATEDLKPIIDLLKDKAKLTKNGKEELAKSVKELVLSGKINSAQSASLIKRFNSVNVLKQESIDNFLSFAERVYKRADYAEKVNEASSLKKGINKLRKNAAGTVNAAAKEFGKIDISLISNIDKYIDIATELKNAVKSNRTKTTNVIKGITQIFTTEISSKKAIDIENLKSYIDSELKKQELQQLERAKNRYEEYINDGSLSSNITLEEVNSLMKELKDKIDSSEFEAKSESISGIIKKEFLDRKSIVEDMIANNGINPLTGEQIEYSPEQELLIKKLISSDVNSLSTKEMFIALDGMDNFLTNGITDGIKKFVAIQIGRSGLKGLISSGIKAYDLKMYFSNQLARFKFKQLDDVNKTLERMFGGISKGDKVADALGFTKVRNGVAKTEKQVAIINNAFTSAFRGKKPNGKHFNDISNTYERGIWSNIFRSPIGTEFAKAEALNKRIQEVKSSYENLLSSTDKKKQKEGKIVQAVFEKLNLNKENITIDEIAKNVAKENQEGVNWIISKWSEFYPEMSDKSLGFDNTVLEQEDNYTPDIIRSVIPEAQGNIGENITQTSPFVYESGRRVNTSKAGVLHASTKASMGDTKYLSFDFDNNNIKKMREALLDLNISEGAYQMKAALENNAELIKLIPNAADMDMLRTKMYAYVENAKGSSMKDSIDVKLADNVLNRLAKASTSFGLSAIAQMPTQTIGAALNTMTQAGEFWELGAAFDKDVNDFIDRTGRPIANRGKEATTTIESSTRYIEKNPDTWYKVIDKNVNNINDFYLNATLQTPDRIVARASFIAYYKKSLKRQGLDYKNLDWKNLDVNDKAADYAETMVSRQQTTSDQYNKGTLFTNKTAAINILKNTLFPFAGFSINQHSRMVNDIITVSKRRNIATTEDKVDAWRSIAGWVAEQSAYHLVNYAITQAIYAAMSDEDDEDKEKRKAFETDMRLTKFIGDVLSPIPQVNDIINSGINLTLSTDLISSYVGVTKEVDKQIKLINDDREEEGKNIMGIKEEMTKRKEIQNELAFKLKTFENKNPYGLYGVAYDKFSEFQLLFGDKYSGEVEVPKYGGDGTVTKYLIPSDKDKLLAPLVVDAIYISGAVRLRELHKYASIKRKELERNRSLTAKEYDMYTALKKDIDFDPESYQFDLLKSGMSLDNIKYDIEWIESKGGMTNKESKEYFKLDKYNKKEYGQGVDDSELNMILKGKTFDQIIKKQ